jgi:hypothetical protein
MLVFITLDYLFYENRNNTNQNDNDEVIKGILVVRWKELKIRLKKNFHW